MKIQDFIWIIAIILIGFILRLTFNKIHCGKQKHSTVHDANVITPKRVFFYIGLSCSIGMLMIAIICWFFANASSLNEKIIYTTLILLFPLLLGGYLIFFYLNYRITVFESYFIYQNFWRVKKTIYYKDVEINRKKLYPQVRIKKPNGKTKLVFKLAGILENEEAFMQAYKNWKNKPKSKIE